MPHWDFKPDKHAAGCKGLARATPALDHLTICDVTPGDLAELAAESGFSAISIFVESMPILPHMPSFNLCDDSVARRTLRRSLAASGLALDVAYPFTLSRQWKIEDSKRRLDCAADLDARFVNALIYDRDPNMRQDKFASFCELASSSFGLGVVLEFFPQSAVRSLTEGLEIVCAVGRPGEVGLNVDLLHLHRSGGSISELEAAPPDYILYGQYCDGMLECSRDEQAYEASSERLLPGDGQFNLRAFSEALPGHCLTSLEIPRETAIAANVPARDRARTVMDHWKTAVAG